MSHVFKSQICQEFCQQANNSASLPRHSEVGSVVNLESVVEGEGGPLDDESRSGVPYNINNNELNLLGMLQGGSQGSAERYENTNNATFFRTR